jgi:hypothetical protein
MSCSGLERNLAWLLIGLNDSGLTFLYQVSSVTDFVGNSPHERFQLILRLKEQGGEFRKAPLATNDQQL